MTEQALIELLYPLHALFARHSLSFALPASGKLFLGLLPGYLERPFFQKNKHRDTACSAAVSRCFIFYNLKFLLFIVRIVSFIKDS